MGRIHDREKRFFKNAAIVIFAVSLASLVAHDFGSQSGYEDGNAKGYRQGFSEGKLAGYRERDAEAYSSLVQLPEIHWRVTRSYSAPHYSGTAYELELPSGRLVRDFIPCERMGWYPGLVITSAAYYNKGDCMSFSGPQANWSVDGRNTTGERQ